MTQEDLALRVRHLHVKTRKLVKNLFAGNYQSVFKGQGLEYDEVREYQYGDDVRFIDWNITSRMSSPYTKTFKEERELILLMVVDLSDSLFLGHENIDKREIAGTIFALLSLAAEANNDKVGSLLFTDQVERLVLPGKGRRHILRQIRDVLGYQSQGQGSDLSNALRTAGQTLKRRSIIVILSDFRMADYQTALNLLAHKHEVIAIRLTDPLDRQFPATGLMELKDSESGDTVTVWGRSAKLNKEYAEFGEDLRLNWLNTCRSAGVDTLEISTEEDPANCLLQFFLRRRKR